MAGVSLLVSSRAHEGPHDALGDEASKQSEANILQVVCVVERAMALRKVVALLDRQTDEQHAGAKQRNVTDRPSDPACLLVAAIRVPPGRSRQEKAIDIVVR